MKFILLSLISIISFTGCNNSHDNEKILNDLSNARKYISQLEDSIYQLDSKTDYGFNQFNPIAYGEEEFYIKTETPYIKIGHLAYNTNTYTDLMYWIDDSLRTPDSTLLYRGKAGFNKIEFDPTFNKKAFSKGKHTIYGKIRRLENGIEKWDDWQYNYENK